MTTKPITNDTLINQLQWRYATKQFDANGMIPAEDWKTLEEALRLSASSFGLQPWKFVVVTNPAIRERLVPVSWNQRQVADASHLVVFAIKEDLGESEVDRYLSHMAETRGTTVESLKGFRDVLVGFLAQPRDHFDPQTWAARQAYIALGNLLTSAALLGIDTCPLEGIEPPKYDEILGLGEQGYRTVVAAAVGYRSPEDKYASLPKVRFDASEVITHIE